MRLLVAAFLQKERETNGASTGYFYSLHIRDVSLYIRVRVDACVFTYHYLFGKRKGYNTYAARTVYIISR